MENEFIYKVKDSFKKEYPNAVTLIDGVGVVLSENDFTEETTGTLSDPPKTRVFRAATQEDLKHLYEVDKHPEIEKISAQTAKKAK
ncbi:MAG: hypothetical protein ACRC1D_03405 [Culicoidibacterales bacterium]